MGFREQSFLPVGISGQADGIEYFAVYEFVSDSLRWNMFRTNFQVFVAMM